jgi:hypothetical protein
MVKKKKTTKELLALKELREGGGLPSLALRKLIAPSFEGVEKGGLITIASNERAQQKSLELYLLKDLRHA